jgi:hypothetical protein
MHSGHLKNKYETKFGFQLEREVCGVSHCLSCYKLVSKGGKKKSFCLNRILEYFKKMYIFRCVNLDHRNNVEMVAFELE